MVETPCPRCGAIMRPFGAKLMCGACEFETRLGDTVARLDTPFEVKERAAKPRRK